MPKQAPHKQAPKARHFEVTVKGVSFRVTPSTMRRISKECPLPVRFQREPDNNHDPNAIKVILVNEPWKDFHIGYVARQTAAMLAPGMDAGTFRPVETWLMFLHPEKSEGGVLVKVP